jgi:hypothetical protein
MSDQLARPTRPDFLCIGAKKAGTTWLYDQLRQHPEIWLPPVKELLVFNDPTLYPRDIGRLDRRRDAIAKMREEGAFQPEDNRFLDAYLERTSSGLDWYAKLFDEAGDKRAGDIDPNVYAQYRLMLFRMNRVLPKMKLIFILRHPAMRSWSHACMVTRFQNIDLTAMSDSDVIASLSHSVVAHLSRYRESIAALREQFTEDRLLFLSFDDIVNDPAGLLRRVWDFLEVEPAEVPASAWQKSNAGHAVPMPVAVHAAMTDFHSDDIATALEVLGIGPDRLAL